MLQFGTVARFSVLHMTGFYQADELRSGGGLEDIPPMHVVFGPSEAMQMLREKVERLAPAEIPVLIQGESGAGKEVLARLIHTLSLRREAAFVKVNCPAIPGTLLETEMFGYEKGAFTGAHASKPGRVERAHRGTLLLDEISEIDSSLQAKLLQLLQDGRFCRIGGLEDRQVDTRLMCTTNRNLEQRVQTGQFAEDLYYRINVVSLHVPPLRERRADIPGLVEYLLAHHKAAFNGRAEPLSPETMQMLCAYDWPGNIRQLENLIKRYVILGAQEAITDDLRTWFCEHPAAGITIQPLVPLRSASRNATLAFERKVILNALQAHHWNRKEAARSLNISYRSLLYKLRRVNLPAKPNGKGIPPAPGLKA